MKSHKRSLCMPPCATHKQITSEGSAASQLYGVGNCCSCPLPVCPLGDTDEGVWWALSLWVCECQANWPLLGSQLWKSTSSSEDSLKYLYSRQQSLSVTWSRVKRERRRPSLGDQDRPLPTTANRMFVVLVKFSSADLSSSTGVTFISPKQSEPLVQEY